MSNQLSKASDLKSLINSDTMREQFARALPKHLSPERFARVAITALTRTPKLAECTQASMMKCLLDLSAMGLEPDGRRAHLIPYGTEATLIVDYKGLVELIRRSGDVVSIRAETVCEKDSFDWKNGEVTHSVNWREDRGEVQAVYAEAVMKSGEKQTAVMTTKEVEGIRSRSRSGNNGPWKTDWAEMAKKTAVRRLSKMLPLSSEIIRHIERDDDQFTMRNVTPAAPSFALPKVEAPMIKEDETIEAEGERQA
jgi:recombination protein RecT